MNDISAENRRNPEAGFGDGAPLNRVANLKHRRPTNDIGTKSRTKVGGASRQVVRIRIADIALVKLIGLLRQGHPPNEIGNAHFDRLSGITEEERFGGHGGGGDASEKK